MRRDVGGHTDGNTVSAVNQQVRIRGRQNRRFTQSFIIVGHKVNGIFINIVNQRMGDFCQAGFSITHGGCRVTIHRTEVTLPVYQRHAHGKRLSHTHHSFINRAVAVRVIFTEHVTDDTRRFTERAIVVIAIFKHRINNTAVHRFQSVTDIRQSARHDNAHGVIKV